MMLAPARRIIGRAESGPVLGATAPPRFPGLPVPPHRCHRVFKSRCEDGALLIMSIIDTREPHDYRELLTPECRV